MIGASRAKELIWSGRQVRADEALAIGLVDRVVPADEVLDNALHWARLLASGAVVAMGLAKRAIDDGLDGSLAQGLDLEADRFADSFESADAAVGIASYLEHGPGKGPLHGVVAERNSSAEAEPGAARLRAISVQSRPSASLTGAGTPWRRPRLTISPLR